MNRRFSNDVQTASEHLRRALAQGAASQRLGQLQPHTRGPVDAQTPGRSECWRSRQGRQLGAASKNEQRTAPRLSSAPSASTPAGGKPLRPRNGRSPTSAAAATDCRHRPERPRLATPCLLQRRLLPQRREAGSGWSVAPLAVAVPAPPGLQKSFLSTLARLPPVCAGVRAPTSAAPARWAPAASTQPPPVVSQPR